MSTITAVEDGDDGRLRHEDYAALVELAEERCPACNGLGATPRESMRVETDDPITCAFLICTNCERIIMEIP